MIKKGIIITALVLAFSAIFTLVYKFTNTGEVFNPESLIFGLVIMVNMLITGSIAYVIYRRFSTKPPATAGKQVIPWFLGFVVVVLVVSLLIVSLGVYSLFLIKDIDTAVFWDTLFRKEIPFALKHYFIWVLIGAAVFFYIIWQKAMGRERILREENLKYQYKNLKNQVNPHFLFNSLNTLSELVHHDRQQADDYIGKLSSIYRYLLDNEEVELISLEKEIIFVKDYFALQEERNHGKINLDINLQEAEKYVVVPVSIQSAVENAIKHNSASLKSPLRIRIEMEDEYVVIKNNLQRKSLTEPTTRKGLQNLKERTRLIMGKTLLVTETSELFMVKIPIKKQ